MRPSVRRARTARSRAGLAIVFAVSSFTMPSSVAAEDITFSPDHGSVGTAVTLSLAGFSLDDEPAVQWIDPAGQMKGMIEVVSWSAGSVQLMIGAPPKSGAGDYQIAVTSSGSVPVVSIDAFSVLAPQLGGAGPHGAIVGDTLSLSGAWFGQPPSGKAPGSVKIGGKKAKVLEWTQSEIRCTVPKNVKKGLAPVVVKTALGKSASSIWLGKMGPEGKGKKNDLDGDGIPDAVDDDRDGDGFANAEDAFPDVYVEFYDDNHDGIGHYAEADEDGDLVLDEVDAFPFDPALSDFHHLNESEFNDNLSAADAVDAALLSGVVPSSYPAQKRSPRIHGELQKPLDSDVFLFAPPLGGRVSVVAVPTGTGSLVDASLGVITFLGASVPAISLSTDQAAGGVGVSVELADLVYAIVLTDLAGTGKPGLDYEIRVFVDQDRDGAPDDRERALGCKDHVADSDDDTLGDATDLLITALRDPDQDGVPSWLDRDSDDDLLGDAFEGGEDHDQDGYPSFVDKDADGNGTKDKKEPGVKSGFPEDLDGDGVADVFDKDDDADGLPDDADKNPTQPLIGKLDEDDGTILDAGLLLAGDVVATGIAHANDLLRISGFDFGAMLDPETVVRVPIETTVAGENYAMVTPQWIDENTLDVFLPAAVASGELSIVHLKKMGKKKGKALASTSFTIDVPPPGAPLITLVSPVQATVGQAVTLVGQNLLPMGGGQPSVSLDGIALPVQSATNAQVVVLVPPGAMSGAVRVVHPTVFSNESYLSIEESIAGQLALPSGSGVTLSELRVSAGAIQEPVVPDLAGGFVQQVLVGQPTILGAAREETPDVPYLLAVATGGDAMVVLNARSTVDALVYYGLLAIGMGGVDADASVMAIRDLPQLPAIASKLESALAADANALVSLPNAIQQDIAQAIVEVAISLSQAPLAAAAGLSAPEVTITPEEQEGFEVEPQPDNPLDIRVINDTRVFASPGMTGLKAPGQVVLPHASGWFAPTLVKPQGGLLSLFFATETDLPAPHATSVRLELITGGSGSGGDGVPSDSSARTLVVGKTLIEGVVVPVLNKVLSLALKAKIDQSCWLKIFFGIDKVAMTNAIQQAGTGQIKKAISTVMNMVIADLKKGPGSLIVKKLEKILGKNLGELAVKKLVARFLPFANVLLVIDIIKELPSATNILATVWGMESVPSRLDFKIEYELDVTEVTPDAVVNYHFGKSAEDVHLIVKGVGFASKSGEYAVEIGAYRVGGAKANGDGTVVTVTLRDADLEALVPGDAEVRVILNPDTKDEFESPGLPIQVYDHPVIDALSPSSGGPGTVVDIRGLGFSTFDAEDNLVLFSVAGGQFAPGEIYGGLADGKTLYAEAPIDVVTGPVYVQTKKPDNTLAVSNQDVIFHADPMIEITYVDNGGAKDDIFALFFDGVLIDQTPGPTWPAQTVPVQASPGIHTVKLLGIAAPDNIGTYGISFSGNVTVNAGLSDPLTGTDLISGAIKTFVIEVGPQMAMGGSGRASRPLLETVWAERSR